ncbi:hypothetical protein CSKR_112315 [Clonorchis sinensis]|uniref:Uncharacterized protein n=1 Tax=Clonorchis sinensis TaxID=79923 RepID=A0A3R7CF79_CLOSI|nr:hypothetical protein CSKR_112315 [Clonorchis sinensis]
MKVSCVRCLVVGSFAELHRGNREAEFGFESRTLQSLEFCGICILFIFTPLSFEWSSSCSGVIILSSSACWELTCEANVLPLLHQRTFRTFRTFTSEQANVLTLERCDWCARPIERRPSNCPGCNDRLTRQSGLPSQVASQTLETRWATFR